MVLRNKKSPHLLNKLNLNGYEFDNGDIVEIKNEPGLLTLIGQSGVMHYTTPNPSDEPRISIAFDLCREPQVTNQALSRHTFIPLL